MCRAWYGLAVSAFAFGLFPALAQDTVQTTPRFAESFGRLVGSELPCGLTFRPDAVTTAIERNVAPDDLEFATTFGLYSRTIIPTIDGMTDTEKRVHCQTIERNAKALGLID